MNWYFGQHFKTFLIISFEVFHHKEKNLSWYRGIVGIFFSKMLVISIKVLSKRLKKNQFFKDTKFRKMLIPLFLNVMVN